MTPAEVNLAWLPVGLLPWGCTNRFVYLGTRSRGPSRWNDRRHDREIVVHRTTVRTRGSVGDIVPLVGHRVTRAELARRKRGRP